MNSPLSKRQMYRYIGRLKQALTVFNEQTKQKILFINDESYYQHIRALRLAGVPASVGELLDILEPYLPLRLSEANMNLFIDAAMQLDNNEADHEAVNLAALPEAFAKQAKLDFIYALRAVRNRAQWERLVGICDAIRVLHEQSARKDGSAWQAV